MGLFSKLFGKGDDGGVPRPDAVECKGSAGVVYAPAHGDVVVMEDIPDPVFASGAMGPAIGIKPSQGVVFAPMSGEVTVTTPTLHALALMSHDGVELLIHIGVDTVKMRGDGFHSFVEKGDFVRAGDPLVIMDLDKIAEAEHDDTVITVITNADQLPDFETVASGGVMAGEALLSTVD